MFKAAVPIKEAFTLYVLPPKCAEDKSVTESDGANETSKHSKTLYTLYLLK